MSNKKTNSYILIGSLSILLVFSLVLSFSLNYKSQKIETQREEQNVSKAKMETQTDSQKLEETSLSESTTVQETVTESTTEPTTESTTKPTVQETIQTQTESAITPTNKISSNPKSTSKNNKNKKTEVKKDNQKKDSVETQVPPETTIAPDEFEKMTLPGTDPNYVYVPPACSYGKWGKKGDIDVKSLEAKANAYAATYDCVVIDDTLDVKSSSWSFRKPAYRYTNEKDLMEGLISCTDLEISDLTEANDFSHGEKIQFYMKIALEYDETYKDYYYFCYPLYLI